MTISFYTLIVAETATRILARGLEVANALGLPTSSWRNGDPTKSLFHFLADALEARDQQRSEFAKAAAMSTAEGDWATVHAKEVYNVDRGEATYATPTVTLRNNGGGYYVLEAGDLTVKCSATGKTFRSTNNPGDLSAGATRTYELVADEAGAASSVGEDEIDEIVTSLDSVEVLSSTSSAARDEESVEELRIQCGDTLGALSPNGPPDAYEYVCKNSELTGVTEINRATAKGDSDTGQVLVYVANSSGTVVSAPSIDAAQAACYLWAAPLCHRVTVLPAAPAAVNFSIQLLGEDIPASFAAAVTGALGAMLATHPIGAPLYRSKVYAAIHAAVPQADSVVLVVPAADVVPADDSVLTLGTVSVVEVRHGPSVSRPLQVSVAGLLPCGGVRRGQGSLCPDASPRQLRGDGSSQPRGAFPDARG